MRQLVVLMIQYIFAGLCEMVDTAFINNTGVDAICVLSAYSVVLWSSNNIVALGRYAYRVNRKNKGSCLCLTLISCIFLCLILVPFNSIIARLYSLTEVQYNMLESAIIILGSFSIFKAFGDFAYEYLLLKERHKLAFWTNAIFYVFVILLDAVVFFTTKEFTHFLLATVFAYIIYDILIVLCTDFIKGIEKPKLSLMKEYGKQSFNLVFDQLVGKIATFIYNIYTQVN